MSRTVYALLVGIDSYQRPVPPLEGCVNDIRAMERLLQARVGNTALQTKVLLNADATRDGIIDGFRSHLAQAGPDDVALFCYSGHGSQQATASEFWVSEPDHKDETLVCYDSRVNGRFDLADKELAKLIAEVARGNPHIVIILDCCHSGTGTRAGEGLAVRRAPSDARQRPVESYLVTPGEVAAQGATRSATTEGDWVDLRMGRHIVLSACRAEEEAREYYGGNQRRGAFSYFLVDTLERLGGALTYRDLFKRVSTLVRSNVTYQTPLVEASDVSDLDLPFLGGAVAARRPYFTLSFDVTDGWVIDGGAVHGIGMGADAETTTLALFAVTAPVDALQDLSQAVGHALVTAVLPHASQVAVTLHDGTAPAQAETYKAVITALPTPALRVLITGEGVAVERAQAALAAAGSGGKPSTYVRPVSEAAEAGLYLVAQDQSYSITRPADGRLLTSPIVGFTDAAAQQAVQRLEHIARWLTLEQLSNPASRLAHDAVRMELYRVAGRPVTRDPASAPLELVLDTEDLRFGYEYRDGAWHAPQFKIRLHNTSAARLYCVLLDLTERFAIDPGLLPGGGAWLEPGQEVWAMGGRPIYAQVPQELWQSGVTEYTDIIKLIVSTDECDATLLEQGKLDVPLGRRSITTRSLAGTLNRLFHQVITRELSGAPEVATRYTDWTTHEVSVTTVRPQESAPISTNGAPTLLGAGVTIEPHPSLQAEARLTSVRQAGRDLGNLMLPPLLRDDPTTIMPFHFTTSRGGDPGLAVLELVNIANPEVVTAEQPLIVHVATPLRDDERVLPVAYDGEFFLPLGVGVPTAVGGARGGGGLDIRLERLPQPVVGVRSLTSSVRIFFQKVVTQRFGALLGWQFAYPQLAAAYVDHAGNVTYWENRSDVQARVAAAQRIVLYVHGIIGDTQGMVRSTRCLDVGTAPLPPSLSEHYDLVLAYDYENINTTIEDNARALKQRLLDVGLGAGHTKTLHVVAHSMGGLVARWFVEREGGNAVVERLVLLGTPNAGSPWPRIQDFATAALAMGLNGLTAAFWPAKVLGTLVGAIEKIDVTLDQMQPASDLLRSLDSSPDPQIPYILLAGNSSLVPAATARVDEGEAQLSRLLRKLMLPGAAHAVINLAFFGETNDTAVTVKSSLAVPADRTPSAILESVACDHITYFSSSAGLQALAKALDCR